MYKNIILFGNSGVGKSYIADKLVKNLGYNKFHTAYYVRKFLYKTILNTYLDYNDEIDKNLETRIFYKGKNIHELLLNSVDLVHNNKHNQDIFNQLNISYISKYNPVIIPGMRIKNNYKIIKKYLNDNYLNILIINNNSKRSKEMYDSNIEDIIESDNYYVIDNTQLLDTEDLISALNKINIIQYKKIEFTNIYNSNTFLEYKFNEILEKKLLK